MTYLRLGAICAALFALGCAGSSTVADTGGHPIEAPVAMPPPGGLPSQGAKAEWPGVGQGFHALAFPAVRDMGGHSRSFDQYQGKVLVLHFWASWCPYCRTEMDELKQLQGEEYSRQGVEVLSISTDQDMSKLRQFLEGQPLPYPIVVDQQQSFSIAEQYGVSSIPVTLIIGRDGRIAIRMPGAGEMIQNVKKVLAESP